MKYCGLISGGKDSIYNLHHCNSHGHELLCLANLSPPPSFIELDSFTFQTVGHHVVDLIAECLEKELIREQIEKGSSTNMALYYSHEKSRRQKDRPKDEDGAEEEVEDEDGDKMEKKKDNGKGHYAKKIHNEEKKKANRWTEGNTVIEDEVETLYTLLQKVKTKYPDVEAVAVGAILSTYQRSRVENVCARLNLQVLSYLWQYNETQLIQEMIDWKLEAIFIKISCIGLKTKKHLGKTLSDNFSDLLTLNKQYDVHVAGEGGEYETLVLDCPLFQKKRIVIDASDIILLSDDFLAPVSVYQIKSCHLEEKNFRKERKDEVELYQTYLKARIFPQQSEFMDDKEKGEEENENKTPEEKQSLLIETKLKQQTKTTIIKENMNEGGRTDTPDMSPILPSTMQTKPMLSASHSRGATTTTIHWRNQHRCYHQGNQLFVSGISGLYATDNATFKSSSTFKTDKSPTSQAMVQVLETLKILLEYEYSSSLKDCVFVHLYLRDMKEFQDVNREYCRYFPIDHPPSRSCVEVKLPDGVAVMLDTWVFLGSYKEMISCVYSYESIEADEEKENINNSNNNDINIEKDQERITPDDAFPEIGSTIADNKQRQPSIIFQIKDNDHIRENRSVLHVRSISSWAPVCIGPYSQANTLKKALTFVAGQIPLIPSSMEMLSSNEALTCHISLAVQNLVAILYKNVLEGGKAVPISLLIYVDSNLLFDENQQIDRDINNSYQRKENEENKEKKDLNNTNEEEISLSECYNRKSEKKESCDCWTSTEIRKMVIREIYLQYKDLIQKDHYFQHYQVYKSQEARKVRKAKEQEEEDGDDDDSYSSSESCSSIESFLQDLFFREENDREKKQEKKGGERKREGGEFSQDKDQNSTEGVEKEPLFFGSSCVVGVTCLPRNAKIELECIALSLNAYKALSSSLKPTISSSIHARSFSDSLPSNQLFSSALFLSQPFHSHLSLSPSKDNNSEENDHLHSDDEDLMITGVSALDMPYVLNLSYFTIGIQSKSKTYLLDTCLGYSNEHNKRNGTSLPSQDIPRSKSKKGINGIDIDVKVIGENFRKELINHFESVSSLQPCHIMALRVHYNRNLLDESIVKVLTERYILTPPPGKMKPYQSSELSSYLSSVSSSFHYSYLQAAVTYIPVECLDPLVESSISFILVQVVALDLEKLATELWVHG